ncbi:MAG TPA: VOC family protein, partial [Pseudonocardiaceae bacterium]|nr:VOC family protein [Pseudonocardiaceae bacterium]
MTEISEYPQGTPCWLDLWTPNRQASMDFYAGVFGWEYQVGPPEQHHYTTAVLKGRTVAGLISPPGGGDNPMVWVTYLAVDDLDAALATIAEQGGQSLTGAIDVPGGIRITLAMDPTGGMFGAWQSPDHSGAQLANEPGTLIWSELMTPDPATARTFYAAVFGLGISAPMSEDFDYTTIQVDGRDVGGIGKADNGMPASWGTYFSVASTDESAAAVRAAGGSVLSEPVDTPYGRM